VFDFGESCTQASGNPRLYNACRDPADPRRGLLFSENRDFYHFVFGLKSINRSSNGKFAALTLATGGVFEPVEMGTSRSRPRRSNHYGIRMSGRQTVLDADRLKYLLEYVREPQEHKKGNANPISLTKLNDAVRQFGCPVLAI
jgi:hypothetical protein